MSDRQYIYRTQWSDRDKFREFNTKALKDLLFYVDYVLWECSTEFMITCGMPSDDDVACWINWINRRDDGKSKEALALIDECKRYIQ